MWPACLGTQWHCSAKSVGGQNPPSPGRGQTRTSLTRTTARPPTPSPPGKLIGPPWETPPAPWCSPCSGSLASGGKGGWVPWSLFSPNAWPWWGEKWSQHPRAAQESALTQWYFRLGAVGQPRLLPAGSRSDTEGRGTQHMVTCHWAAHRHTSTYKESLAKLHSGPTLSKEKHTPLSRVRHEPYFRRALTVTDLHPPDWLIFAQGSPRESLCQQ